MSWAYQQIRRSPLPPRSKPLRAVSKKRRRETKQRRAVLAEVGERDGVACRAQAVGLVHDCVLPLDGHELRSRAHYPGGHLDASNVILVCRYAHSYIHDNPLTAMSLGLLRSARLEAERG